MSKKVAAYALACCAILLVALVIGLLSLAEKTNRAAALQRQVEAWSDEKSDLERRVANQDGQIAALLEELDNYRNPKGGVAQYGWLSVQKGQLVDERGEPVQLRGVSSHGIMWYPQYGNYRSLQTLRKAGANLFRIAMYTTENRGYTENQDEAMLAMRTTLENVLGADMYAIVDWHVLKEQNPNVYVDQAVEFFSQISSLYANEPGVIYEICNEPNGETTWDDIKAYADRVIPAIRSNAPDAVILVGTPEYCTKIEDAVAAPLPYENLMYTYHFYADLSQGGYQGRLTNAREKGIGVFVSEWGIGAGYDESSFEQLAGSCGEFLDYLDENGVSWVCWALSNKDEGHAMLLPSTSGWSNWNDEELTPYGRFVFGRLGGGGT